MSNESQLFRCFITKPRLKEYEKVASVFVGMARTSSNNQGIGSAMQRLKVIIESDFAQHLFDTHNFNAAEIDRCVEKAAIHGLVGLIIHKSSAI
jgi:hypothetical protein